MCGLAVYLRGTVPERTALVFRVYDVDAAGALSYATMRPLLEAGEPAAVAESLFGSVRARVRICAGGWLFDWRVGNS